MDGRTDDGRAGQRQKGAETALSITLFSYYMHSGGLIMGRPAIDAVEDGVRLRVAK